MRNKRKSGVAGFLSALSQPVTAPPKPPSEDISTASASGSAVGSALRKREPLGEVEDRDQNDARPSKRQKVAGLLGPGYEEFDASHLVPFVTKASELPKHLNKCTLHPVSQYLQRGI